MKIKGQIFSNKVLHLLVTENKQIPAVAAPFVVMNLEAT